MILDPEPWMREAACIDTPTEMFFPGPGKDKTKPARAMCAGCPVRLTCLDYAQRNKIEYGIYGGLNETERKALLQPGSAA